MLFSGSLKYNLDPFEEYKDSELWNVLEQASNTFRTHFIYLPKHICMHKSGIFYLFE